VTSSAEISRLSADLRMVAIKETILLTGDEENLTKKRELSLSRSTRSTNMMPNMMSGMGASALFWIMVITLLCLILTVTFIWLFVAWLKKRRIPTMQDAAQPQDSYQGYEQGYQPQRQTPEIYQEGGQHYPYSPQYEQPQAQYPQVMPSQH
jgi:hypothetical protein